jgi:hypothetical protein
MMEEESREGKGQLKSIFYININTRLGIDNNINLLILF